MAYVSMMHVKRINTQSFFTLSPGMRSREEERTGS